MILLPERFYTGLHLVATMDSRWLSRISAVWRKKSTLKWVHWEYARAILPKWKSFTSTEKGFARKIFFNITNCKYKTVTGVKIRLDASLTNNWAQIPARLLQTLDGNQEAERRVGEWRGGAPLTTAKSYRVNCKYFPSGKIYHIRICACM